MRRTAALLFLLARVACSRQAEDPPIPWKRPPAPAWDALPETDQAALALEARREVPHGGLGAFDPSDLASLKPDATSLVAGAAAIAAAYDGWMRADATRPAYVLFGATNDSREEREAVTSIVLRMRAPWGVALEQRLVAGRWAGAPRAASDRAPATTKLEEGARAAGLPLFGCGMPPELRASLTSGGAADRGLRELHCADALRDDALALAAAHPPDGGLSDDNPAPPERFVVLLGAGGAAPDGLPRFLGPNARVALARVLGGQPGGDGDEAALATRLVVTNLVLVRLRGVDAVLVPDATWGGDVERAEGRAALGPHPPAQAAWLPPANVAVTSDAPARFGVTDSTVDVGRAPEWLSARAGRHAYVLVSEARTFVGAIDVPDTGWLELSFSPAARAVKMLVHRP